MSRLRVLVCALAVVAGCSQSPPSKEYQLVGQIVAMAPERREVTIQHGDIKGFMPGMTMPFVVKDAALLDGKSPGDLVTATLVVGEVDAHLSSLTTTGHRPVTAPPPAMALRVVREGEPIADAALVDENGSARPLASFRGHRLALTFMYTRCPIPDFCPLMNRHFAQLQEAVQSRPELSDVHLVTVTLDPAYDTPAVLKVHGRLYKANPDRWTFLTGMPADVNRFAAQFGIVNEADPDDPSQIIHSLRTAVIDPSGRLATLRSGNDWTPTDLLADLTAAPAPKR